MSRRRHPQPSCVILLECTDHLDTTYVDHEQSTALLRKLIAAASDLMVVICECECGRNITGPWLGQAEGKRYAAAKGWIGGRCPACADVRDRLHEIAEGADIGCSLHRRGVRG